MTRAELRRTATAKGPTIPCEACEVGHLTQTEVHRLSRGVVRIGYLILIPSVVSCAFVFTIAFLGIQKAPPLGFFGLAWIVGPVVSGWLGLVLTLKIKKSVLRCPACSATLAAT